MNDTKLLDQLIGYLTATFDQSEDLLTRGGFSDEGKYSFENISGVKRICEELLDMIHLNRIT